MSHVPVHSPSEGRREAGHELSSIGMLLGLSVTIQPSATSSLRINFRPKVDDNLKWKLAYIKTCTILPFNA